MLIFGGCFYHTLDYSGLRSHGVHAWASSVCDSAGVLERRSRVRDQLLESAESIESRRGGIIFLPLFIFGGWSEKRKAGPSAALGMTWRGLCRFGCWALLRVQLVGQTLDERAEL